MPSVKVPQYVKPIPKIAVCIPTRGVFSVAFANSVFAPLWQANVWHVPTEGFEIVNVGYNNGYDVAHQRNFLTKDALKTNADYIWWLDDDQLFSGTLHVFLALRMLLAAQVPIVSGITRQKTPGWPYAVYVKSSDGKYKNLKALDATIKDVDAVGSYCMLMKREVYERMQEPYYEFSYETGAGEDFYFCEKAKALGYDIKAHTQVKLDHIGHAGDFLLCCDGEFRKLAA